MDDLETSKVDAEVDGFSLIDVSTSDDDFLLASSSDANIVDNPGQNYAKVVPVNQPSDSLVAFGTKKTGKCNLRKSLAWDSAFFTNAGVLDPEELSSILEGAETGAEQNHFLPALPGIQEELSKSTDSISTLQSDNLTLESLEADLFSDIRASIQRCSKSSTIENSCGSKTHGDESMNGCSPKTVEPSSHKVAKHRLASNKLNSGVQGPVRISKLGSVDKQEAKPPVHHSRIPRSSVLRPHKAVGEPSLQVTAPTKRMSAGVGRVKLDANAAGNSKGAGKGSLLSGASHQVDSKKPLPKTSALSKIPAASSVLNRTTSQSSRSSCDSSGSCSSLNVRKSQTGVIRRKMDKNVNLSSGSKTRTLSKVVKMDKSQNKESRLSAYLKSATSLSSSISPASSVSDWSIESASSTATVNPKHLGLNPHPPCSQHVTSNVSQNLQNLSNDRALGGHENQVPGIFSQTAKQPSTGNAMSSTRPGSAKPSSLRMPSPKIGFFDGVKAGVRTPNSSQSRPSVPSSLPRSLTRTLSSSGTTNKTKNGTGASKMTAAAAGTAKPKQKVTVAKLKTGAHVLDHSVDLQNPSGARHIDNDSETSELLRSTSANSALEQYNEILEASDPGKVVPDSWLVGKDNLASEVVAVASNNEPQPDPQRLEVNLKSTASIRDHSLGLQNPPSASSELSESNLSTSAVDKDSEVAKTTDVGKQAFELASVAKDNLSDSEKDANTEGKLLISVDLGNFTAKHQLKSDSQSTDPILKLTAQVQGHSAGLQAASRANIADNDSQTSSELSKVISCKSAIESSEVAEVADGEKHSPDFGSLVKDKIVAPKLEGNLHLTDDLVTETSEDGSSFLDMTCVQISCVSPNMEQIDRSNSSTIYNLTPSRQVDEADDLNLVNQKIQQEEGGRVEHRVTDENQCLENELVEIVEIFYAEKQVEGLDWSVEPRDHKMEMQGEPGRNQTDADGLNIVIQQTQQEEGGGVEHNATDENQCLENELVEIISTVYNLTPSRQVDETDDLNLFSQKTQPEGVSVEHGATDENRCLENELVATNENPCAENQVEGLNRNVEPIDYKVEVQEDLDTNVESETMLSDKVISVLLPFKESCNYNQDNSAQFGSLFSCSPLLSCSGFNPATRTPFVIRNSVSNVVEVSNSLTGSNAEALSKADAVPFLEKSQKENS